MSEPSDRESSFTVSVIRVDFWEGDAMKHFSVKKGFSVKRGEAIQSMRGLVRILQERQELRAIH